MKRTSRIIVLLLAVCAFALVSGLALAESSGTCGENLIWILDDNGLLTISGTGDMNDYGYAETEPGTEIAYNTPWYDLRSTITAVRIEENVTGIGEYAFAECTNLAEVFIANSVTSIRFRAFFSCRGLTEISISANVTSIGMDAFINCDNLTRIYVDP